jgi:2-polyprenyl-6-methoxyphenol hydroxylase-like FAD-dependent oxidoreductase
VRQTLGATPPDMLVDYRIMWRDPQPTWTSPSGRVLQLGDAAHTFHPSSGNGGTQAVEDAVSIAECLSIAGKDNVEWATRVSNLLRYVMGV